MAAICQLEIFLQSKSTFFVMWRKKNNQVQRPLREHAFDRKRNCPKTERKNPTQAVAEPWPKLPSSFYTLQVLLQILHTSFPLVGPPWAKAVLHTYHLTYHYKVPHSWKGGDHVPSPCAPTAHSRCGVVPFLLPPPQHPTMSQIRERSSMKNKSRLSSSITAPDTLPLLHISAKLSYLTTQKLFCSPVLGTGKLTNTLESKPL